MSKKSKILGGRVIPAALLVGLIVAGAFVVIALVYAFALATAGDTSAPEAPSSPKPGPAPSAPQTPIPKATPTPNVEPLPIAQAIRIQLW